MEIVLWLIVGMAVGFACGYWFSVHLRAKTFVGTLREDHSDPTEAPYLFLELDPGGMDKIHQYKIVTFKVKIENYIPRR